MASPAADPDLRLRSVTAIQWQPESSFRRASFESRVAPSNDSRAVIGQEAAKGVSTPSVKLLTFRRQLVLYCDAGMRLAITHAIITDTNSWWRICSAR
jgi:hypothetical protein